MDCRDAQFYLRLLHPGSDEFEPEVTAALDRHLDDCPACAAAAQTLGGFDAVVATAMQSVPVPDGLRDRLFAAAGARQGAQLRRRAYRFAAAAASVLVAVGLAVGFYNATRPRPSTDLLVSGADETTDSRQAEKIVRDFLRAQGLPERLPDQFNYSLFIFAGTEKVQGRDVPVVMFRDRTGPGWAKVYAFRKTVFDLKAVPDAQASHFTAKVYSEQEAVTYVVVYSGHDLARFLLGNGDLARLGCPPAATARRAA